jgi:L-asparaginase/Glu-tRNA(Gln) amidotransferase subunit D
MKFNHSFGPQENYRLDTIANTVLGERKLSYDDARMMSSLLASSDYVTVKETKIDSELFEFEKWCRLKDKIKAIAKTRDLL